MRRYLVWVRGQRLSTECEVEGVNKAQAIARFAFPRGLKTIQCDAMWMKA